jgi:hypothetical protein
MTSSNPLVSFNGADEHLLFLSNRYSVISKGNDRTLRIRKKPEDFAKNALQLDRLAAPLRPATSITLENEMAQEVAMDIRAAVTHDVHPTLIDTLLDNFLVRPSLL